MNQMHRLAGRILLALACMSAAPVWAWPDRPIEIVVGFAPGGGTDITARTLAVFLEKSWAALLWLSTNQGLQVRLP